MSKRNVFGVAALLWPFAIALGQQVQDDSAAVLQAAAAAMRARFSGRILLDENIAVRGTTGRPWPASHDSLSLSLLRQIFPEAKTAGSDNVHCPETANPRACHMTEGSGVIAFGVPEISSDSALVFVHSTTATGIERIPIADEDLLIILARRIGGWRVVAVNVERKT